MTVDRKKYFVEELKAQLAANLAAAREAEVNAAELTESIRSGAKSKADAKTSVESGRMAIAHSKRRERIKLEIDTLIKFSNTALKPFHQNAAIGLGAMADVEVENLETGQIEEKSFFILPVGAGTDLKGPGGDGSLSVITPDSPVGRALVGTRVGDSFETMIQEKEREWTVMYIC